MRYLLIFLFPLFTANAEAQTSLLFCVHKHVSKATESEKQPTGPAAFQPLPVVDEPARTHFMSIAAMGFALAALASAVLFIGLLLFNVAFIIHLVYIIIHLSIMSLIFSKIALSDIENEPLKWKGRKRARRARKIAKWLAWGIPLGLLALFIIGHSGD